LVNRRNCVWILVIDKTARASSWAHKDLDHFQANREKYTRRLRYTQNEPPSSELQVEKISFDRDKQWSGEDRHFVRRIDYRCDYLSAERFGELKGVFGAIS
jgi:hypothetical protein